MVLLVVCLCMVSLYALHLNDKYSNEQDQNWGLTQQLRQAEEERDQAYRHLVKIDNLSRKLHKTLIDHFGDPN